jgi:ribosome maturation factor RimP
VNGRRRFVGKLLKVSPQDIQIEMGGEQFELALANIHRARLSPQW